MVKIQKSQASPKPPLHRLKTHIYNQQKALPLKKPAIRNALIELVSYLSVNACERAAQRNPGPYRSGESPSLREGVLQISVYFVSEKKITELHDLFFQDPTPTD